MDSLLEVVETLGYAKVKLNIGDIYCVDESRLDAVCVEFEKTRVSPRTDAFPSDLKNQLSDFKIWSLIASSDRNTGSMKINEVWYEFHGTTRSMLLQHVYMYIGTAVEHAAPPNNIFYSNGELICFTINSASKYLLKPCQ